MCVTLIPRQPRSQGSLLPVPMDDGWERTLGMRLIPRSLRNTLVLKGHSQLLSHPDLCNFEKCYLHPKSNTRWIHPQICFNLTLNVFFVIFDTLLKTCSRVFFYSSYNTCIIITFGLKQYELCILWYENQLRNGI